MYVFPSAAAIHCSTDTPEWELTVETASLKLHPAGGAKSRPLAPSEGMTNQPDSDGTTFRVRWEIDLEATDPRDAARRALAIQRDPASTATHFEITPHGDGEAPPTIVDFHDEAAPGVQR